MFSTTKSSSTSTLAPLAIKSSKFDFITVTLGPYITCIPLPFIITPAAPLDFSKDSFTLEASFKEDLDADSLDLFELVMALEEEYDVEIPSDDLAELNTVGDVINYLKDKGVED